MHELLFSLILNVCLVQNDEDPSTALGCDPADAAELLRLAFDLGLRVVGLGFSVGSQEEGATSGPCAGRPYAAALEKSARLLRLGQRCGHEMRLLSVGGGFPSQRGAFEKTAALLNRALDEHLPAAEFPALELIATPGRFFASAVFSLCTSIIDRDPVDASHITEDDFDLGKPGFVYRTNEGFYGAFNCQLRNARPECAPLFDEELPASLEHDDEPPRITTDEPADIFCTSVLGPSRDDDFDVVQRQCRMRRLSVGDWLLWNNMGAYSMRNAGSLELDADEEDTPPVYYFTDNHFW